MKMRNKYFGIFLSARLAERGKTKKTQTSSINLQTKAIFH